MNCSVAFTRIFLPLDAVVRSTVQGENTRTRRSGLLLEGAECRLSEEPALQFYPQYAPEKDETIEVTYRGRGRAMARVTDSGAIAARRRGNDDGVRGEVRQIKLPAPRTSEDCETAALALLDDAGDGWAGEYKVWSSFLPGGARDIFPGDGLAMQVPSRAAVFNAIVTEVSVEVADLEGENCEYTLRFVDAGDPTLDFVFEAAATVMAQQSPTLQVIDKTAIATAYLADLSSASANDIASTTVTIDAGVTPGTGQVVEVRLTDNGWGTGNDRNLVGRFTARSFTVPRYGKVQDYFLRIADNNSPPRYSRHSAALHIDYPY